MAGPQNRRQYIQRIPAYLPMEASKVSYSPAGSWRTVNVDSKSASISSGYGTPRACQMDNCYHHHSPGSGFTPSEAARIVYFRHEDLNRSSDTVVEENFCERNKRAYNAIKQKSGEICYIRSRENSAPSSRYYPDLNPPVPPHRHECCRHPGVENNRSFEKHERSPQVYRRYVNQADRHRQEFYPDNRRHQNVSRHSMYMPSDSNESWRDSNDDYWPVGLNYPPDHTKLDNWKSEINLFDPQRFKVDVSTLDEEATQIYNEILDVAGSLAYEDQMKRAAEKRLLDVPHDQRKSQQKHKSLNHFQSPQNESSEKVASRPFPRPLDSSHLNQSIKPESEFSRRSRRLDNECTPTNVSSPWLLNGHKIEHPQETVIHTPDSDTESALAALDSAVNFDFRIPSATSELKKCKSSGPTPIIREYIGEAEGDWRKIQARNFNGKESPTTFSVIEIDDISEEEEDKRRVVALPLDEVERELLTPTHALHIGSLNQNSGSFSERTPIDDLSYMSDVDI
nr:conserved hypothetical protein [Hymenolepis microstoma]